jgi:hypothetical protein
MWIIGLLCQLALIVCWIIVVIKMFQTAGAVQGILGIICSLWAFIWGWMNSDKVGKNIMLIWTAALVLLMIVGATGGFSFKFGNME